jgi:hypothetical protein
MQSDSKIDLDPRFNLKESTNKCGAKVINFKDIKEQGEPVKDYDKKAKKLVNVMSLFNEFSKKHQKSSISFQVYSDYLESTFNSEDYKFNDKTSAYQHEDIFIPCTNRLYFKLSDNDSIRKNTIALECDLNGEVKLSFKLGRYVIDIEEEEFDGFTINDSKYGLGLLGAPKTKDQTLSSAKYTVKEAKSKSFEEYGKDWVKNSDSDDRQMFVLDVFVIDAPLANILY